MYLDFVDSNGRVTIMTTPLSSQQAAISPKTLSESAIILQRKGKGVVVTGHPALLLCV